VTPLLVAAGAALGAALRFWVAHHLDDRTPWGTLAVNVAGSFVLGLLVGSDPSAHALALLGTGLCGGLTTYSAFAVQTRDQGRDRGLAAATAYAVGTIGLALAACALGFAIGQA
jgi:fluoride exporter